MPAMALMKEASTDLRDERKNDDRRHRLLEADWDRIASTLVDWRALPGGRGKIEALLMSIDSTPVRPKVDLIFMDGLEIRNRSLGGPRNT